MGELLDHEEALAIRRIAHSLQRAGDQLCAEADLRGRIRRHPLLATGLGAFLGCVGGPLIPRSFFQRILSTTSSVVIARALTSKKSS